MKHKLLLVLVGILGAFGMLTVGTPFLSRAFAADVSVKWVDSDTIKVNGTEYTSCKTTDTCQDGTNNRVAVDPDKIEYYPDGWTKPTASVFCDDATFQEGGSNVGLSVVAINTETRVGMIQQAVTAYEDSRGITHCFGKVTSVGIAFGPNDGIFTVPNVPALKASFVDVATITTAGDVVYTDNGASDGSGADSDKTFVTPAGSIYDENNGNCDANYIIRDFSSDNKTARRYIVYRTTNASGTTACSYMKEASVRLVDVDRASNTYAWSSETTIVSAYGNGDVFTRTDTKSKVLTYTTGGDCQITLTVASADQTKDTTGKFTTRYTGSTTGTNTGSGYGTGGAAANEGKCGQGPAQFGYPTGKVNIAKLSSLNPNAVGGGSAEPEVNTKDDCPLGSDAPMRWLGCAVFAGLKGVADKLVVQLDAFLYTDPNIFNENTQKAAGTFRNIGMALVLIAGLAMVISQALGLDFLDAYTVRKLLPKLGIALIGMALAWPLLKFAVGLTNDIGGMIYSLFLGLAAKSGATGANVGIGSGITTIIGGLVAGVGVAGYAVYLGSLGFLSLFGTIILAILIGVLVLSIRQLVIFMAIIMAPLAIAAYVFPGGEKIWKFWKTTLITTLIMYPLIMGFIGAGAAMAYIMPKDEGRMSILAIIVYFAPFFMLPFAFKLAGGLMTTIFSLTNDKSKGMFDHMSNYRKNSGKRRWGKLADGSLGSKNGLIQRTLGTAARMSSVQDVNYLSARGRRRFGQESKRMIDDAAKKRAELGMHHVGGDTVSTLIGMQARNRDDFVKKFIEYNRDNGSTASTEELTTEAQKKMARLEGGFGADIGSRALRRASMFSHITSDNGAWDGVGGAGATAEMAQAAKEKVIKSLIDDDIATVDDYAAIERVNKGRAENLYGSFGQHVDYIDKIAKGKVDDASRRGANANMYKEVAASGATTANKRAVDKIAAQMNERLTLSSVGDNKAFGTYVTESGKATENLMGDGGIDTWAAEYAAAADIHEAQMYSGQGNAEAYATVMKNTAFTRESMATMPPDIRAEAEKLMIAAEAAGQSSVTHQDVKNHLQGNTVMFTDASGREHVAQAASADTVKKFTARKKEWPSAQQATVQQQRGASGEPGQGQGVLF